MIEKVRAGQDVEEATDDIVYRSATEIRKNFFGESEDEAKDLKWKREQAGAIMQGLCEKGEVSCMSSVIYSLKQCPDLVIHRSHSLNTQRLYSRHSEVTRLLCER